MSLRIYIWGGKLNPTTKGTPVSTNGTITFVANRKRVTTYNHSDSYFGWLGVRMLEFAESLGTHVAQDEVRAKIAALVPVNEADDPTPAQAEALGRKYWRNVDTGANWYAYLRECQGNPARILDSGYIVAHTGNYASQEYGYVLNLDSGRFEAYRNGQKLGAWSLDTLPSKADFEGLDA